MKTSIFFLFAILVGTSITTIAQDIIIKNDRSEIESRVIEISETQVKYKKWKFQDGPLYNLLKSDVFMIMYANGQRELMRPENVNSTSPVSNIERRSPGMSNATSVSQVATSPTNQLTKVQIDTTIDYKNIKVKYKPTRILVNFNTPLDVGFDQELRLVKNVFNIGFAYHIIFPTDYATDQKMGFFYGSVYFPINRLSGKYKAQDKGLFLFGHAGYRYNSFKLAGTYGYSSETYSSGGFSYRLGADYLFSKRFGVTFATYEFKTFYAGIVASIL